MKRTRTVRKIQDLLIYAAVLVAVVLSLFPIFYLLITFTYSALYFTWNTTL